MSTIGERIARIIEEQGMTQSAFAKALWITPSSVSTMVSGKSNPSAQTLDQICTKFGYNPDWLATGEGEPRSLAPVDQQVIDYLTHAIKYKSKSADRLIRAVAVAAAECPESLDAAIDFLTVLVDEYRQHPPDTE